MHALILVDIQNDFMPGGALAVPDADAILAPIHREMHTFDLVIATQDWHPADHGSFASQHSGVQPFETGELHGLPQVFWPDHCVQWTGGACIAPGLDTRPVERVFPKGTDKDIDSYSGFYDNGHRKATGLTEWLRQRGVTKVTLAGLATDYCVKATALDAVKDGFQTTVWLEACRGIFPNVGSEAATLSELRNAGIQLAGGA